MALNFKIWIIRFHILFWYLKPSFRDMIYDKVESRYFVTNSFRQRIILSFKSSIQTTEGKVSVTKLQKLYSTVTNQVYFYETMNSSSSNIYFMQGRLRNKKFYTSHWPRFLCECLLINMLYLNPQYVNIRSSYNYYCVLRFCQHWKYISVTICTCNINHNSGLEN